MPNAHHCEGDGISWLWSTLANSYFLLWPILFWLVLLARSISMIIMILTIIIISIVITIEIMRTITSSVKS